MNGIRAVENACQHLVSDLLREEAVIVPDDNRFIMHEVFKRFTGIPQYPVVIVPAVNKDYIEFFIQAGKIKCV